MRLRDRLDAPGRAFLVPPLRGLALVGAGGLMVAGLLLAVAVWPTHDVAAYRAAGPCRTLPSAPTASCHVVAPATVTRAIQSYGRGGNHYYLSLDLGGASTTVRIDAFLNSFPRYRPGDVGQAQIWNGRVTRLTGSGGSFVTTASPLAREQDFRRAAVYVAAVAWLPFLLALMHHLGRTIFSFLGIGAHAPQPIP